MEANRQLFVYDPVGDFQKLTSGKFGFCQVFKTVRDAYTAVFNQDPSVWIICLQDGDTEGLRLSDMLVTIGHRQYILRETGLRNGHEGKFIERNVDRPAHIFCEVA